MAEAAEHSPAFIVQRYLREENLLSDPEDGAEWPGFFSSMPDLESSPDKAIALYDTAGIKDGRSMKTGFVYFHEGFNLRVRAGDDEYLEGYRKAQQLFNHFGTVKGEIVFVEAAVYKINAISMTSGIIALGESEERGRRSWTINAIVTISDTLN